MKTKRHKNNGQWWRIYGLAITAVFLVALIMPHAGIVTAFLKGSLQLLWLVRKEAVELVLIVGAACFRHGKR